MRLFGFSPTRATRPIWTLAELGIDYEAVTEDVFKHPELKNFHPLGRLPVLDVDGKVECAPGTGQVTAEI